MNFQDEVYTWHMATFPNATIGAITDKLSEESLELNEACKSGIQIVDEIADVIIVSCALLSRYGMDINDVVKDKMVINKNRRWGKETNNGDRPRDK